MSLLAQLLKGTLNMSFEKLIDLSMQNPTEKKYIDEIFLRLPEEDLQGLNADQVNYLKEMVR